MSDAAGADETAARENARAWATVGAPRGIARTSGAALAVPRLAFEDLVGGYGGVDVVRGVSGGVGAGEVLCVIGRNGVGKSTLLKLLTGQLTCRAGRVRLDGRAIDGVEASARRSLGITYCPQERPVFDDLSVRDNLMLMRPTAGSMRLRRCSRASRFSSVASISTPARFRAVRRRSSLSRGAMPRASGCACSMSRAKACSGKTSCRWRR